MDKAAVLRILESAWNAPYEVARPSRAYVVLGSAVDKETVKSFKAAAKSLGLLFLPKAYGTGKNALYVGYDNADGRSLGKAAKVAELLKAAGIPAYRDAVGD